MRAKLLADGPDIMLGLTVGEAVFVQSIESDPWITCRHPVSSEEPARQISSALPCETKQAMTG